MPIPSARAVAMKAVQREFRAASFSKSGKERPQPSKPVRHNTPRDCPRVTLRLSEGDHARLKKMADGMALATFIRAKVLEEQLPRRKPRSSASIADTQAIAQVLGLLGQSRIANNLNQLAYHANVGSLVMDDVAEAQIEEAYDHILLLRQTLLKALGMRG